jgi:2-C-methyl-D-erythritol 2,4-cyclodiphosphate synthase
MGQDMRIGTGYDVHRLADGKELWLGGVRVPHVKGAVGHSDADVLLHVICDALLGARALGDIGTHFPDTDPNFKGIDSKILLARTWDIVRADAEGGDWSILNVDTTLCLEQPKVRGVVDQMRACISEILDLHIDRVSVKATTTEGLGFVGEQRGVSAHAVVLLVR